MAPAGSVWRTLVDLALEVVPEQQQPVGAVCLEAFAEPLALLKLGRGVPECVRGAAKNGLFCAIVQEPSAATAWVPRHLLPRSCELLEKDGAEEVEPGAGWCAIRIGRPGSGRGGLRVPAVLGTAGTLCALLAEVPIGAHLLSAFGSEVLLVLDEALPAAAAKFVSYGHAIWPSTRVCDPKSWESVPSNDALVQQLAGAWSLVQREEPLGTIVEEYTEGDGPLRLQAPGGLFVEIRMPENEADSKQASFGGRCRTSVKESNQVVSTQVRSIDFQPPTVEAPQLQVTLGASSIEEVSHPNAGHRELWARLGNTDESEIVALELQSEVPEPKIQRCGIWLFAGRRFARLIGLPRGSGLVSSSCCRSLAQLQRLRGGTEIRYELREHYEALHGVVEGPGLLRIRRVSGHPKKIDKILYSALDESTGEIVVGQDCIVHLLPGGRRETWRIVQWTFDPFTPKSSDPEPGAQAQSPSSSRTRARSQSSEPSSGRCATEEPAPCLQSASRSVGGGNAEAGGCSGASLTRSEAGGVGDGETSPRAKLCSLSASPAPPRTSQSPSPAQTRLRSRSKSRRRRRRKRAQPAATENGAPAVRSRSSMPARRREKKKRKKGKRSRAERESRVDLSLCQDDELPQGMASGNEAVLSSDHVPTLCERSPSPPVCISRARRARAGRNDRATNDGGCRSALGRGGRGRSREGRRRAQRSGSRKRERRRAAVVAAEASRSPPIRRSPSSQPIAALTRSRGRGRNNRHAVSLSTRRSRSTQGRGERGGGSARICSDHSDRVERRDRGGTRVRGVDRATSDRSRGRSVRGGRSNSDHGYRHRGSERERTERDHGGSSRGCERARERGGSDRGERRKRKRARV